MNIEFSRVRDFYIYTKQGSRLVDLDLAQGRAVFGHKPKGLIACIKRELDKGLLFSHENATICYIRFLKALQKLFPFFNILTIHTCSLLKFQNFMNVNAVKDVAIWRPYTMQAHTIKNTLIFCVLPLPWDPPILICMYNTKKYTKEMAKCSYESIKKIFFEKEGESLLEINISSVLYTALTHVIHVILRYGVQIRPPFVSFKNRRDIVVLDMPRCNESSIEKNRERMICISSWKKYKKHVLVLPKGWRQDGVYIHMSSMSIENYKMVREMFFNHGFMMPLQGGIITLPYFFTKKELEMWNIIMLHL